MASRVENMTEIDMLAGWNKFKMGGAKNLKGISKRALLFGI